ncbi:MAG: hypothetical protein ACRDHE_12795, partial [Ktedonobacterales bacterium]
LKYRAFAEFDAAYRELAVGCPRCGRSACADCWDVDHQMCGSCVAAANLRRSPQRGLAADGPLADGRLRCVDHGQFADAAQPSWLDALLSAERQNSGDLPPDVTDTSWMRKLGLDPEPRGGAMSGVGAAPSAFAMPLHQTGTLAHEPTAKLAALPDYDLPRPSDTPAALSAQFLPDFDSYAAPEGRVTSNKVKCPRCGAANYDFVTNCTACQLQLIQNCSMCGKLNPGHAHVCEFCGSSLDRPRGWAMIQDAVQPLSAAEARAAVARPPAAAKKQRTAKHKASRVPAGPPPRPDPFSVDADSGAIAFPSFLPVGFDTPATQVDEAYEPGLAGRLLLAFERVITIIFWLTILTLAVSITAAEVSPHADQLIKNMTHIDIRVVLAHFGVWARRQGSRLHK